MKYLLVRADTNDADYVRSFKPIEEEILAKFLPLFQAIKDFKPYKGGRTSHRHNFPTGDCCREDMGEKQVEEIYADIDPEILGEFQEEYMPNGEFGTHTINEIKVFEVTGEQVYL